MILVDTTCLVHAVGDDHARQASARDRIEAVLRGDLTARTTGQVIMEFAHVRSRRRDRQAAASLARASVTSSAHWSRPLPPTWSPH